MKYIIKQSCFFVKNKYVSRSNDVSDEVFFLFYDLKKYKNSKRHEYFSKK